MKCFVDIETTGLTPWKNEIITMAVIITEDNLERVSEYDFKFRPESQHTWTHESQEIHGISWDEAIGFPSKKESNRIMQEYFDAYGRDLHFICHAFPFRSRIDLFDYQFLLSHFWESDMRIQFERYFPERRVESTIIRSPKQASALWGIENQKLDSWAKKLGIKLNHHDARSDVEACYEIYKHQRGIENNESMFRAARSKKPATKKDRGNSLI